MRIFQKSIPIEEIARRLSKESMKDAVLIGLEANRERYYPAIVEIDENHGIVKYDYDLLVECFAKEFSELDLNKTEEEAIVEAVDYVDSDVLRAIPYWGKHAPIIEKKQEDL